MDYALAKKLKDAGFPQEYGEGCFVHRKDRKLDEDGCYTPSLSELIEACGENIRSIDFLHDMNVVVAHPADSLGKRNGEGITTEEAVANLWLVLNK